MGIFQIVTIWIGGILIALRCYYPLKYVEIHGINYDIGAVSSLYPSTDFNTTILQVLAIAVVTGLVVFSLQKIKEGFNVKDKLRRMLLLSLKGLLLAFIGLIAFGLLIWGARFIINRFGAPLGSMDNPLPANVTPPAGYVLDQSQIKWDKK